MYSSRYGAASIDASHEPVWELFHENTKLGRHAGFLSPEEAAEFTRTLDESVHYVGRPAVELPRELLPMDTRLSDALERRVSTRELAPAALDLSSLSTLLHYAYGVTRSKAELGTPRSLRTVPSAGALFPLELYFHVREARELESGLYHYQADGHVIRCLQAGDASARIAELCVHGDIARRASLIVFITALLERVTCKYADRGYRYVLLEAGHVAQNLNLAGASLGLGSVNLCGYYDREVDAWLGIQGLAHSTLYVVAMGGLSTASPGDGSY